MKKNKHTLKKCSCSKGEAVPIFPVFKSERLSDEAISFWVECQCGRRTSTYVAEQIDQSPISEWNSGGRVAAAGLPHKRKDTPDDFQTPGEEWARLFPHIPKHWKIWECACGKGKGVKAFQDGGFDVIGTDVKQGHDFLLPLHTPPAADCIITNVPFSLKDNFLERAYELGLPFIFLMPVTALAEQGRIGMWTEHGFPKLLYPPARINFETPSGEGTGASFYSVWFAHGFPGLEPHTLLK